MPTPLATRQTAVITGASRGIGRAIARRLARSYEIVAVARSEDALRTLAREIEAEHGQCRILAVDVSDPRLVEDALADVEADVLVNNAGVAHIKPLLELSVEEWHEMAAVNFNALFYVTRALLPAMVRRRRGDIVTVGSLAGRNALVGGTGYAGTKHAVIGFSESLMLEVRQYNVRVSTVMPGSVATGLRMGAALLGAAGDGGWMVAPEEIAEAVAYILRQPANTLVSRVEVRPTMPPNR